MLLVFEKQRNGGRWNGQQDPCDVMVTISPYRRGDDTDCMAIRISGDSMKRAGWHVGDRCIPQYDKDSATWTLCRTTNAEKGYRITQSTKSRSRAGNVKVSLSKDTQIKLGMNRGDRQRCQIVQANGDKIVAVAHQ